MSHEVEMLAMVIADLRLQVETLKESVNRRDALIDETKAEAEENSKSHSGALHRLSVENSRLRASILHANSELRERIKDDEEYESVRLSILRVPYIDL